MTIAGIAIIALMIGTAGALIAGITLMARGGAANVKYGNKMMVLRVTLQGLTLLLLALLFAGK